MAQLIFKSDDVNEEHENYTELLVRDRHDDPELEGGEINLAVVQGCDLTELVLFRHEALELYTWLGQHLQREGLLT